MEAFNFTCANEDCNLYTYDMRKLKSAACIHKVRHIRTPCCLSKGNVLLFNALIYVKTMGTLMCF